MLSMFSYLITIFAIMFWGFRAIVSLFFAISHPYFCEPINAGLEIALLFLTIPCMLFIIKRNLVAATIYFGMYAAYFGAAVYETVLNVMEVGMEVQNTSVLIVNVIGVIVPLLTFLDILLNKNRRGHGGDRKTDWFYKNKDYDREFDDRADRNQYKIRR